MSSGLDFSGPSQSLVHALFFGVPDHLWIYTGIEDVFRFALTSPAEHPPNRVGRYRNCDPLALGAIVSMGHTHGGATADTNLRAAQSLILGAIEALNASGYGSRTRS